MATAKGSAHFGHEKQMTPNQYLLKVAKLALKNGETEEQFVAQFVERFKGPAGNAYQAANSGQASKQASKQASTGEQV